ncbi:hypothetical protein [Chamaesiphon sp. VAR_48_metabat_135_sub]|uniref:hypothetical protein n=1 Tax=Chamaesiphon sp. VAR_48_metabat_135_sub TaxID=2964699 RepID=UPI00286AC755|nr:hypothetical protein [Chamaesiphon sp. VAR_48_metabat_135_sub]
MISHPFQTISLKKTIIFIIVFLIITLSITSQLNKIGKPLTIPVTSPLGIISLEFAFTARNAQKIVKAWSDVNVLNRAIDLQRLDFLFIAAYSMTLSFLCILATKLLSNFDPRWLWAGIILAWGQLAAALFDVIENLCLFPFLYGATENLFPLASLAAVSAGLKFILIGFGVIYFLISVGIKICGI